MATGPSMPKKVCKKVFIYDRKNNLIRYDKNCYTEDNILIYTLFVANIPESVNSSALKQYFTQFGEVEEVTFKKMYKADGENRHRAIVRFTEFHGAGKAIRHRFHKLKDVKLAVRGADSWIQPHKVRLDPLIKVDESDTANYAVLKLNEYCIFNIFSYLSFQDQVRFSSLCDRFKKIFIIIYKNKKYLKITPANIQNLTLMEINESFGHIGKLIESLEIDCRIERFHRIYDFIFKYFPNLKKLHLSHINKKFKNSNKEIPLVLKKLTHLTLIDCHVTDEQVKKFAKLERLEYLDLSENEDLVGKYLHNLKNIKHLDLNNCKKLEITHLKPILNTIPIKCLKVLGIRNTDIIGSSSVHINDVILEEFHFTSYRPQNTFLKSIPSLKNLKRIRLLLTQLAPNDTGLRDFLTNCVAHKSNEMEYLGLLGLNLQLTKDNVDLIVMLKKLKELELNRLADADCLFWTKLNQLTELVKLDFFCHQENFDENEFLSWLKKAKNIQNVIAKFKNRIIKMDFISSVIDVLKELRLNTDRKILISIQGQLKKGDDGNENILQDEKYLANRSLIEIILKEDGVIDKELKSFQKVDDVNLVTSSSDDDDDDDDEDDDDDDDDNFLDDTDHEDDDSYVDMLSDNDLDE